LFQCVGGRKLRFSLVKLKLKGKVISLSFLHLRNFFLHFFYNSLFAASPFWYILFYNLTLFLEWMFVIKLSSSLASSSFSFSTHFPIPLFIRLQRFSIECGPRCILKNYGNFVEELPLPLFTLK